MDVIIELPGHYISEVTNVGKVKSKYFHKGETVNFPDWYAKQLLFLNLVSTPVVNEVVDKMIEFEKLSNEQALEVTEILTEKKKKRTKK